MRSLVRLPHAVRHARLAIAAILSCVAMPPLGAQGANAQPSRIGIIDSRRLLHDMPGRSAAESQYALELNDAQLQVRAASDSMKVAIDALTRIESQLRPAQRESAMMQVRARELALEDMVAQLNVRADRRLGELQAPLMAKLAEAVRAVRVRERLALVIDLAASPMVVDADATLDIHAMVLEELRRRSTTTTPR